MALLNRMQEIDTLTLEGLQQNKERLLKELDARKDPCWFEELQIELHYTIKMIEHKKAKLNAMW